MVLIELRNFTCVAFVGNKNGNNGYKHLEKSHHLNCLMIPNPRVFLAARLRKRSISLLTGTLRGVLWIMAIKVQGLAKQTSHI